MIHTIINGHIFTSKIVDTPDRISRGMMGSKFDKTFNSMLFVFPKNDSEPLAYDSYDTVKYEYANETRKNYHCFWMKNCIIPLDMIFIKNNIVQQVHHSCQACLTDNNCTSYCGFADCVLEVDGGTCKRLGITVGNIVKFSK